MRVLLLCLVLASCAAAPPPAIGPLAVKPAASPKPAAKSETVDDAARLLQRRELQDALDRAKAHLRDFDAQAAGPQ